MSRLGKMPGWQRTFVICGMMTCSITGLVYLLGHQFHIQRSTLGAHNILAAHGIAAMLATLAIGSVLPFHLKAGFKSKKQWWSGFSQLGFLAVLLISGSLLYYGPEEIRDGVIDTHWIVGLLFFIVFILHAFSKIRSTRAPHQCE
jgi:4-amino-4-deoxy-L-arabinose transferase-like glycosyltransferase